MSVLAKFIENKEHHMIEEAYDHTEFHWIALGSVRATKKMLFKNFMHMN